MNRQYMAAALAGVMAVTAFPMTAEASSSYSMRKKVVSAAGIMDSLSDDSALDSRTSRDVLQFLKELNAEGNTIIVVTHDNSIALEARRVVRIHDGRIQFDGEAKEYEKLLSSGSEEHMGQ